ISTTAAMSDAHPSPREYSECFVTKIKSFNIVLAGDNVATELILYNPNLSDLSLVNYIKVH
ncbi:MAG: HAD family hydrolase, partial [Candidatus Phytoplasma australasiaticum]|nr:HAD family hydrolase [Candidatus Phytoplasma australasiaticum]